MRLAKTHARFAGASAVATLTDGLVFGALAVGQSPFWSALAALLAAVAGAGVHFTLCRRFVFDDPSPVIESAARYVGVSATTAVLHAASVASLVALGATSAAAWAIAKVIVYFGWSFPAARHLVFERR